MRGYGYGTVLFVITVVGMSFLLGFGVSAGYTEKSMQSDILKAERASLGRPLPYSNLPSGLYVVVKVLDDHNGIAVISRTMVTPSFILVGDMPRGMMEDGFKFGVGSDGRPETR